MIGFNGLEGLSFLVAALTTNVTQQPITNGTSEEIANQFLTDFCKAASPLSVDLCVQFVRDVYGFDKIRDDKERLIQLTHVFSKLLNKNY